MRRVLAIAVGVALLAIPSVAFSALPPTRACLGVSNDSPVCETGKRRGWYFDKLTLDMHLLIRGTDALEFDWDGSTVNIFSNAGTMDITDTLTLSGTVTASGTLNVTGTFTGDDLAMGGGMTVVEQTIGIPFSAMRVFDNTAALLPVAGLTDDLGQVNGTLGTNAPSLQTEDLKAAGATSNSAYFEWVVPASYLAGSTVTMRAHAGMLTTAADTTATLDAECWVPDYANDDGTVSTDLVTPAAQSINSTTLADIDFVIDDDQTDHAFAAGSLVQCKITTAVNDGATGTAVIGIIRKLEIIIST